MNKEKLRRFPLPMKRVDVFHAAPAVREIHQEYWIWEDEQWQIRCDWFNLEEMGTYTTCVHCETEHNLAQLFLMARSYGFEG